MRRVALCLSLLVCGSALADNAPVIFRGERGLAPVQVVYDYLKDRIADENGLGDYRTLDIKQQAAGDNGEQIKVEVVIGGLHDDSVASQRYRIGLHLDDTGWIIDHADQDWKCRRGGKGWVTRPCK